MGFDFDYPNSRPDTRGWPSGYPNCHEEAWVPIVASNGVGFGRVHREIADLLVLILNECIRKGYPPKQGQCWGSVCRCSHRSDGSCAEDAAGNPVPSNHSYGLAIDFNSAENVYGADRSQSAIATEAPWVAVLFRRYGFRWLGPPIDDWQHFDFAGTPADARRMTRKAQAELTAPKTEDDQMFEDFMRGWNEYEAAWKEQKKDPGPPPENWKSQGRRFGWSAARFAAQNPKTK